MSAGNKKEIPKKLQDDLNNAKLYKASASAAGGNESGAAKVSKVLDDSKERAMYDEIFGSMLGSKDTNSILSTTPAAAQASKNNVGNAAGGLISSTNSGRVTPTDFTTSLLSRLKVVETEAKNARAELSAQVADNDALRMELSHLKTLVRDPSDLLTEIATLQEEKELLHDQIDEMEAFLGDYGLQWVGSTNHTRNKVNFDTAAADDNNNDDNNARLAENKTASKQPSHPIAYADFVKAVDSLNDIIYSEPTQVVVSGGHDEQRQRKARLAHASELVDNVRIIFYKNGIMVKNGPFRYCGTEEYKTFVKDIMEGYFPSEFKAEYPDGVVFDLKDQRNVDFLEGAATGSGVVGSSRNISKSQLLNRLPKTVIHKGQVVSVRGDIAAKLSDAAGGIISSDGSSDSSSSSNNNGHSGSSKVQISMRSQHRAVNNLRVKIVLDTPAAAAAAGVKEAASPLTGPQDGALPKERQQEQQQQAVAMTVASPHSMGQMVKIQVKWIDRSVFIATMYEMNTVGDLREQIIKHVVKNNLKTAAAADNDDDDHGGGPVVYSIDALGYDFELRVAYPPKLLSAQSSLLEAGLVPNGTVHARKV